MHEVLFRFVILSQSNCRKFCCRCCWLYFVGLALLLFSSGVKIEPIFFFLSNLWFCFEHYAFLRARYYHHGFCFYFHLALDLPSSWSLLIDYIILLCFCAWDNWLPKQMKCCSRRFLSILSSHTLLLLSVITWFHQAHLDFDGCMRMNLHILIHIQYANI